MTNAQTATAYAILHNPDDTGTMADRMVESFGPEAAAFALECQRDADAGGYDGHAATWWEVRTKILEMAWQDPKFRAAALRALRN